MGHFDIEASHSFSLRNYGKDKASLQILESLGRGELEAGKGSAMSNYSRIVAESQHPRSQRDLHNVMVSSGGAVG